MAGNYVSAPAIEVSQSGQKFYLCVLSAKTLSKVARVDMRDPEEDKGYQRLFVDSHIRSIKKYLESGKCIPSSLLVTFKGAKFSNGKIRIRNKSKNGWIIDGQHRWLAAREMASDVDLPIIAFIDLPLSKQIEHFITINREAKGVPSSLYLDLLKSLPKEKTPGERAKERATDIARTLTSDEESPFYGKIVVLTSPKRGELSLTNFVRKVESLVRKGGALAPFKVDTQTKIIGNYFNGIIDTYSEEAERNPPIFFQTIGFGAFMSFFPAFFSQIYSPKNIFTRDIVRQSLVEMGKVNFDQWREMGTGTQAENTAAAILENLFSADGSDSDEPSITL
jgi:DGQHR domain-containing protein